MEIIKVRLPSDYTLVISGDLHIGSPNVNEDHIKEMVEHVATTKNCFLNNIWDNADGTYTLIDIKMILKYGTPP